jgi:hypothetical protein
MLVTSIFSIRAAVGLLCLSFFLHSVIILPQNVTGIMMAVKMKAPIPVIFNVLTLNFSILERRLHRNLQTQSDGHRRESEKTIDNQLTRDNTTLEWNNA